VGEGAGVLLGEGKAPSIDWPREECFDCQRCVFLELCVRVIVASRTSRQLAQETDGLHRLVSERGAGDSTHLGGTESARCST
jgi:hypothetical protein